MNIWIDKENERCLSVTFDKSKIKNKIKYKNNNAIKGLDSICIKVLSFFGIILTYTDLNYNRIINIVLSQNNDNYKRSKNNHQIIVFKETLSEYIKNNLINVSTPFNWNYSLNETTGDICYYITGEKKWFYDHNLEDIVNGYIEIVGRDKILSNKDKFPKYNLRKTNKVIGYSI